MHMREMAEYHARESLRAAYLTNDPECRERLLKEAQEWLQEARLRGSKMPLPENGATLVSHLQARPQSVRCAPSTANGSPVSEASGDIPSRLSDRLP
jgi:hypothetical protein